MRGSDVKPNMPSYCDGEDSAITMTTVTLDIAAVLTAVRKILLAVLAIGMVGSATELILLAHTEDWRQWIPLILLAAALIALAWHWSSGSAISTQALRWLMLAFVISGLAGVYFHFQGSAEFKLESNPTLAGWALFRAAIGAKAPPFLAPGAMIQLGLLGLVYSYVNSPRNRGKGKGESL